MIPLTDAPLSAADRIAAARARAQIAYADQTLNAQVPCPLAGGAGVPPHGGDCAACTGAAAAAAGAGAAAGTRSHSLIRTPEAQAEVRRFYDEIRAAGALGGVAVARLDDEKGNMLGALVCIDTDGNTQVLRAFSGLIDESGVTSAAGCSPMLPPPSPEALALSEAELATVDAAIAPAQLAATTSRTALQGAMTPHAGEMAAVKTAISGIYRAAGTREEKVVLAAPWEAQKAVIAARYAAEQAVHDADNQAVRTLIARKLVLVDEIKEQYSGARLLSNFTGAAPRTQRQACTDAARVQDMRTGNCAAPKMIAEAQARGWTPVAVAEIWIGKNLGTQTDFVRGMPAGTYVPSCECCRAILGHVLCGLPARQLAAGAP
jgi:hypothetical protein